MSVLYYKTLRRKRSHKPLLTRIKFFRYNTKRTSNKRKSRQTRSHQNLECLCLKGHHPENKKTATEWDKTFAAHVSATGLVSRLYQELLLLNNKRGNFPGGQWLRFHTSNARGTGSTPGPGIKIPHFPDVTEIFFLRHKQ